MRCGLIVLCTLMLTAVGCVGRRTPDPVQKITPGSRIIYDSGTGNPVWSICSKGDRIYMAAQSPNITVIAGGCPDGEP